MVNQYRLEVSYWDYGDWTPYEGTELDDPVMLNNLEYLTRHAQTVTRPGVRYRIVQVFWESPKHTPRERDL